MEQIHEDLNISEEQEEEHLDKELEAKDHSMSVDIGEAEGKKEVLEGDDSLKRVEDGGDELMEEVHELPVIAGEGEPDSSTEVMETEDMTMNDVSMEKDDQILFELEADLDAAPSKSSVDEHKSDAVGGGEPAASTIEVAPQTSEVSQVAELSEPVGDAIEHKSSSDENLGIDNVPNKDIESTEESDIKSLDIDREDSSALAVGVENPIAEETSAPSMEETSAPSMEETSAPNTEEKPALSTEETPAPITEETPAPITEETPALSTEEKSAVSTEEISAHISEETSAHSTDETLASNDEKTSACSAEPISNKSESMDTEVNEGLSVTHSDQDSDMPLISSSPSVSELPNPSGEVSEAMMKEVKVVPIPEEFSSGESGPVSTKNEESEVKEEILEGKTPIRESELGAALLRTISRTDDMLSTQNNRNSQVIDSEKSNLKTLQLVVKSNTSLHQQSLEDLENILSGNSLASPKHENVIKAVKLEDQNLITVHENKPRIDQIVPVILKKEAIEETDHLSTLANAALTASIDQRPLPAMPPPNEIQRIIPVAVQPLVGPSTSSAVSGSFVSPAANVSFLSPVSSGSLPGPSVSGSFIAGPSVSGPSTSSPVGGLSAGFPTGGLSTDHSSDRMNIEPKIEEPSKKEPVWCDVGIFKGSSCLVTSYYEPSFSHDQDHDNMTIDNVPDYSNSFKIDLEPGTAYKFRICAINSCGRGPWSEVSAFKTCLPGYPGAPSSIKISKSTEGAHLSWEPPTNPAGTIIEYSVCLAVRNTQTPVSADPKTQQQQLAFVRVYCGPQNQTVVPNASLAAAHIDTTSKPAIIFRIAAKNEKGFGPATQVRWLQDVVASPTGSVKPIIKKEPIPSGIPIKRKLDEF